MNLVGITVRPARLGQAALVTCGLLLASSGSPALAQEPPSRFLPWMGCWVPVGTIGDGVAMCFQPTPAAGDGVEMVTVTDGRVDSREVVLGEGEERPTSREGCEGSESARLSPDGRRVYTRSAHTCEGGVFRSATGVMSFVSPTQWIDVRSVLVDREPVASVQYYQLASSEAVAGTGLVPLAGGTARAARDARRRASLPPTIEHVVEASGHVDGNAVEAWVVEAGQPFRMTGDDLVAMDDAGVPEGVIDAMIAVSFPDKFSIDRAGRANEAEVAQRGGRRAVAGAGAPYESLYFGYGYDYLYGFGGFGYSRHGYWYRGYRPIRFVVSPRPPRTSAVVNGRGYTQRRSGGGIASGGGRGGQVRDAGGSYRPASDSGSRSTGRTAKPRRRR